MKNLKNIFWFLVTLMLIIAFVLLACVSIAGFFAFLPIIGICLLAYRIAKEKIIFKRGRNPYARICRMCGAHQDQYRSNIEGSKAVWWEEMYPIGDDPNCECHSYARQG